jgi:hypothetical protein
MNGELAKSPDKPNFQASLSDIHVRQVLWCGSENAHACGPTVLERDRGLGSAPGERTDSGLALTMTATAIAAAAGYARA